MFLIMTIKPDSMKVKWFLTKQEANQYRSRKNGGNINIAKLADTIVIREEADIEKVTSKLVSSIKMAQLGGVL